MSDTLRNEAANQARGLAIFNHPSLTNPERYIAVVPKGFEF